MELIYILTLHFIADFLLQDREMATKKSEEFGVLIDHLVVQNTIFFLGLFMFYPGVIATKFAVLNALIHGVIDWNIWKLYRLSVHYRVTKEVAEDDLKDREANYKSIVGHWAYYSDSWFYNTIGLDQLLHGITLVLLKGWLL